MCKWVLIIIDNYCIVKWQSYTDIDNFNAIRYFVVRDKAFVVRGISTEYCTERFVVHLWTKSKQNLQHKCWKELTVVVTICHKVRYCFAQLMLYFIASLYVGDWAFLWRSKCLLCQHCLWFVLCLYWATLSEEWFVSHGAVPVSIGLTFQSEAQS